MSLYADRVKESSTSTGTGTISLGGTADGYRTFVAGLGSGNQVCYTIEHTSADEWEVGVGTVAAGSPDTLSRTYVISSSNSGSLVNFSGGTKNVFCTVPARQFASTINMPPANSSVYDDEFTTIALDAKWTVISSPSGAFTFTPNGRGSWATLTGPGAASDNSSIIRQPLSGFSAGTPITVTARLGSSSNRGNTTRVDVSLSNNSSFASGSYVIFGLTQNGVEVFDGSADVSTLRALWIDTVYIHASRDAANNFRVWISGDPLGEDWTLLHTETRNWDASYMFLRLLGAGSSGNPGRYSCDWIRVNDPRFVMPA